MAFVTGAGRRTHILAETRRDHRGFITAYITVCSKYAMQEVPSPTERLPLCKHCEKQKALSDRDFRRAAAGVL